MELSTLLDAWASGGAGGNAAAKTNAVVLHAIGGAGKSALLRRFLDALEAKGFPGAAKVYGWSAYSQDSGDNRNADADGFISRALKFFGHGPSGSDIPPRGAAALPSPLRGGVGGGGAKEGDATVITPPGASRHPPRRRVEDVPSARWEGDRSGQVVSGIGHPGAPALKGMDFSSTLRYWAVARS